jgi:trimeric autotransporter adhesin
MKCLLQVGVSCLFFLQMSFIGFAQSEIISTVAGNNRFIGNGGFATAASLYYSSGVSVDSSGNLYIADTGNNRIRKVTGGGIISTVAGNGNSGYSGDGGTAALAQLDDPSGVAVDSSGNLYIADTGNNRIRKVTAGGIISTVAGNGNSGYSGDGGPAALAQLDHPYSVAVDSSGNLYIADTYNSCIRKVTAGGIISTVAGNGKFGFSGNGGSATLAQLSVPFGVAVDSSGNLYIADTYNSCIRKVTAGGTISTVAGNRNSGYSGDGSTATLAQLSVPTGVAVDSSRNLYIADTGNNRIRKVTAGGIISTVAGNGNSGYSGDGGTATLAKLDYPYSVAVDSSGNLHIADTFNSCIRKVTAGGIINTVAGNRNSGYSGDGSTATLAKIDYPYSVAVDSSGNLYIADTGNNRIRKVTVGGIISTVAGNGGSGYSGDGGTATLAKLDSPMGVAVDSSGNLYIADTWNNRIRKVTAGGIISTVAGNGNSGYSGDGGTATLAQLDYPTGVAVDSSGNLYIADTWNSRIRKVTAGGIISTVAGNGNSGYSGDGGTATLAQLDYPIGVAVDSSGNLYIADTWNSRIRKVTAGGIISTVAGNGDSGYSGDGGPATLAQLSVPFGVAVDSSGNLYIADSDNNCTRKVTAGGIISTVAGNGDSGYSGDGSTATLAQLSVPSGVAVDSSGNLYIADNDNNCIRKAGMPNASFNLDLNTNGIGQSSTLGTGQNAHPGYATVAVKEGTVPYGTAVFSFKQDGVTVSEAGIPASPPTSASRIFIDYRSGVNAVPARGDAGVVDINTGIAVVNPGPNTVSVTYTLRDAAGDPITTGHGTINSGKHFSGFINQLPDVASDFNLPEDFQTAIQFGTLDITSSEPISVLALRGTANQKGKFIITTTPVADLTQAPGSGPAYFAQFVDGGGYTTSLILMNTSAANEIGTIQIKNNNGNPLTVNQVGGSSGSSFRYSIPPDGIYRFQTDGFPADWSVGWVQLTPDSGTSTPIGSGVYGFNPEKVLVTESGVPSATATTHARIYVDRSGNHNTGLAIANINGAPASITIKAFESDGVTAVGTSNGPISLSAYEHQGKFADEYVTGLPDGTGVLDISSTTPFAALTMRSLINENGEFLITTFPVADVNQPAPSPIVFPQIADGGGYTTQFILLSTGEASSTTINYYDNNGNPLAVGR